jgi:hypothetical protein
VFLYILGEMLSTVVQMGLRKDLFESWLDARAAISDKGVK